MRVGRLGLPRRPWVPAAALPSGKRWRLGTRNQRRARSLLRFHFLFVPAPPPTTFPLKSGGRGGACPAQAPAPAQGASPPPPGTDTGGVPRSPAAAPRGGPGCRVRRHCARAAPGLERGARDARALELRMAVGGGGGASSAPPLAPWLPSTRSQPSPSQERDTFWTRQSVSHLPELGSQTTHPLFCFELLLPQGARLRLRSQTCCRSASGLGKPLTPQRAGLFLLQRGGAAHLMGPTPQRAGMGLNRHLPATAVPRGGGWVWGGPARPGGSAGSHTGPLGNTGPLGGQVPPPLQ
ncbi:uncharacterized protein [Manis javanica]|uniref:uncharacterized protein isoform X2 n=1 Tax=Manis javanica TaxID=9974 RepID=UPI003C6D5097